MIETLLGFLLQLVYLFSHMTFGNVLDITLVALIFFIVFQALHQTRTLQLLRGVIIIGILGAALLVLLPLATLNWLVRLALLAGVIALPLLFQDDLRRALTGLGRIGRRRGYGTNFERFKEVLVASVDQLSAGNTGALIVLEGQTPLDDIIETGIPLQTETVTPELLGTIFHPNTPLHDGAVILRGDRVMAASCILPIQTESTGLTHLGTRHRAALGLSSMVPDALVIIISEETGNISVTKGGRIYRNISLKRFAEWLDRFSEQLSGDSKFRWLWLGGGGWRTLLINLLMAVGLSLIAWVSVVYQTNPPGRVGIENVPLIVSGPDAGLLVIGDIPETVRVVVQSTQDRIENLGVSSVRAELPLDSLPAGVHQVEVDVKLADPISQALGVEPASVNLALEPELSQTLTPTVMILDLDTLPPGYAVEGPELSPGTIAVKGPKSLVETIAEARVEVSLGDHRTDFQQTISPVLLDAFGVPVEGLSSLPKELLLTVPIRRTFFTREIGIQADLVLDTLKDGYQVTDVSLTPATVTIAGSQSALDSAGEFLVTAPISLTGIYSELSIDVPLILPEGASALNDEGETLNSVRAHVLVEPFTDYFALSTPVTLRNLFPSLTARTLPTKVTILLVGPRPLLAEIKADPSLVVVFLDLEGYEVGAYDLPLEVEIPPGFETQLFPSEVQVILEDKVNNQ